MLACPVADAGRISVLPAWRDTGYFDSRERAALALIEAIILIPRGHVSDEVYEQAVAALNAQEIATVEWPAIVINTWNRIAIASRYPVGE